jgi:serine/threonine protein kinase
MALDAARAKSLFLAASDLIDPAERAAYLERECGGDAELRARVEALLRANDASPLAPHGPTNATREHSSGQKPQTEDYDDPTACVGSIVAGKYKLIEEIGVGGMGSVYMAQQTNPVKRAVAVKVIKAGMDSKTVLARFEAERQALAMMDHPNIARVLDAETTDGGRPFFVMELVKGMPFTQFCDQRKLTPRQRLELFVPVCQAIQHAHQKGVIHRDIKPNNVLVALYDDRPVPKVIDFGVAKAAGQSLTDMTLMTGYGAVVGTPEYMSPEQANLNNLDIDTRSDVYSLGVLLYELLTGTTPVDRNSLGKAALLEVLRIVREVEPQRPSAKLSTIETLPSIAANRSTEPAHLSRLMKGELDWVVLKALEKDRTRRYDTANALARDIHRYLADEVVEARPPSTGYRVRKFVRKNRGTVSAASLIFLALLVGISGTTWGLIRADQEAGNARRHEADAKQSEADAKQSESSAIAARNDLAGANNALRRSTDTLLTTTARSLLRPLALQVQPDQPFPPLNAQEIEPLWELASSKDEPLRIRFVEVALLEPASTRRLKDRAAFAFQATVGLNGTRRKLVEELLASHLEQQEITLEQQEDVALCLAQLGGLDRPLAGRTAATLARAMSKTTDAMSLQILSESLSVVVTAMEPKDAAQAAAILTQAMCKTTELNALHYLSRSLSVVASSMEPKVAAQASSTLTQAMSKTTDVDAWQILSQSLSAVAARLESSDAGRAAIILAEDMSKTTDVNELNALWDGLFVVAPRLEPKEAAQAATVLSLAMSKTADFKALNALSAGLSAVAVHLKPKDAARACGQAGAVLTRAMGKTTDGNTLRVLSRGLSVVAAHLEPKDADQAATTLTQAMSKTTNFSELDPLTYGLSAVALRLEPKDAAQAATTHTQAMSKTTHGYTLQPLSHGLSALANHMEPKDAARACGQAAAILTQAMSKTTDFNELYPLSYGLSAVALRLEPKDAAQAATTLTQAMSKTTHGYTLQPLSQGLSALATQMEPKDAARACGQAAATLTQAMSETTNWNALHDLSLGRSALAAHMDLKEAAHACGQTAATLTQAMSKTTDVNALQALSQGLSAVASHMEPKGAARACGQAAATLTQAMSKTTDVNTLNYLWRDLPAVATHLEPKDATWAATTLIQAMSKTTTGEPEGWSMTKDLLMVLTREEAITTRQHLINVAATVAGLVNPGSPFPAIAWAQPALERMPPPLPVQMLVDILKNPFCVGEARKLVLEQLTRHYNRPFADQWEFVDYVHAHKLDLDLNTPPERPGLVP